VNVQQWLPELEKEVEEDEEERRRQIKRQGK